MKLLEENKADALCHWPEQKKNGFEHNHNYNKSKTDKRCYIKVKSFCRAKETTGQWGSLENGRDFYKLRIRQKVSIQDGLAHITVMR